MKVGDRVFYPKLGWGKIEVIYNIGIDRRAWVKFGEVSEAISLRDLLNSPREVSKRLSNRNKVKLEKCNECDKLVVIIQEMLLNKVTELPLVILIEKIKNVCKNSCSSKKYFPIKFDKECISEVLERNRGFYIIQNDSVVLKESLESSASEDRYTGDSDDFKKKIENDDFKELINFPALDDFFDTLGEWAAKRANEIKDVPDTEAPEKNDSENVKTIYSMVMSATDTLETAIQPKSSFLEGSNGYKEEKNQLADIKPTPDFPELDDSFDTLGEWAAKRANEIKSVPATEVPEKNDSENVKTIYSVVMSATHTLETAIQPKSSFLEGSNGYKEEKNQLADIKTISDFQEDDSKKQLDKNDDGKELKNFPTIDDSGVILSYWQTTLANESGDPNGVEALEKSNPPIAETIYSMEIVAIDTLETAMEPRSSFLEGSDVYKEEKNQLTDIDTALDFQEDDPKKQLDKNDDGKELKNLPTIDDSGIILGYWETLWANESGNPKCAEASEKNDPPIAETIYSTEIVTIDTLETAMEPKSSFLEGSFGYNEENEINYSANTKSPTNSGKGELSILIRKRRKIKIDI